MIDEFTATIENIKKGLAEHKAVIKTLPKEQQDFFNPIIEKMEKSLNTGDMAQLNKVINDLCSR